MALTTDELAIVNRALHAIGAQPITASTVTTTKQGRLADAIYPGVRDEVLAAHPWNEAVKRTTLKGTADVNITAVNQGTKTFTIAGDYSKKIQVGDEVTVSGSTGNDGDYTAVSATFSSPNTDVVVEEAIPDGTADGTMNVRNTFKPDWGYDHGHQQPSDILRLLSPDPQRDDDSWTREGELILSDHSDLDIAYVHQLTDPLKWSALLSDAITAKLAAEMAQSLTADDRKHAQQIEIYRLKMNEARTGDSRQSGPTHLTRTSWIDARRRSPSRESTGRPLRG